MNQMWKHRALEFEKSQGSKNIQVRRFVNFMLRGGLRGGLYPEDTLTDARYAIPDESQSKQNMKQMLMETPVNRDMGLHIGSFLASSNVHVGSRKKERAALWYMFRHMDIYTKDEKGESVDITEDNIQDISPSKWKLWWKYSYVYEFEILTNAQDRVTSISISVGENEMTGDAIHLTLDPSMIALTKLERLELDEVTCNIPYNNPPDFSKFSRLKTLLIANSYFDLDVTQFLKQLWVLEELTLVMVDGFSFEVEEDISRYLSKLRKLVIRNVSVMFSPWMTKLNLATLVLSNTKLKTLPASIGDMTALTSLDLSDNDLRTLPESFKRLTNLTKLDLTHNEELEGTIPREIYDLPGLEFEYRFTRLDPPSEDSPVKRTKISASHTSPRSPPSPKQTKEEESSSDDSDSSGPKRAWFHDEEDEEDEEDFIDKSLIDHD